MKKILLTLVCIFAITTVAFTVTDYLIKSPSGNLILDAATGYVVKINKQLQLNSISTTTGDLLIDAATGSVVKINKTLQVDAIKNYAGTSSPPGMVPIGGIVAVYPTAHANAWQPPASGAIKDGFMRADGGTVPACSDCIIPAGAALPDLRSQLLKGGVTTSGGTGGASSYILAANQIPQLSGSFGSGGASANHTHGGTTDGGGDHVHWIHNAGGWISDPGGDCNFAGLGGVGPNCSGYNNNTFIWSTGTNGNHGHTFGTGWMSADHSHTTTVTLGSSPATAINWSTQGPAYTEIVWVIRVK